MTLLELLPDPKPLRRSLAAKRRANRLRAVYSERLKKLWQKPDYRERQLRVTRRAYEPDVIERRSQTRKARNAIRRANQARRECGNPHWRRCSFCKKYDAPENLYISKKGCKHRACAAAYARKPRVAA